MSVEREDTGFLLSQYLDDQLAGRAKAELEHRLDADADLREELRRLASLEGHLAEMGRQSPEGVDYDAHLEDILSAVTRKALLRARPKRRVLRPVFRVAAVAAVAAGLVVAASVAWVMFRPAPTGGEPTMDMRMLRAAATPKGPAEVLVTIRDPENGEVRLDPHAEEEAPDGPPPGTVFVSIGPPPAEPAEAPTVYPFGMIGGL